MPAIRNCAVFVSGLICMLAVACTSGDGAAGGTPAGGNGNAPPATASPTTGTPAATARPADGTPGGFTGDSDARPPALHVTTADGTDVEMRVGTYCWGGICADAIGIVTPIEPLQAAPGEALTLGGDAFARATGSPTLQLSPAPAAPVGEGDDWLAWRPEGEPLALEVANGVARLPADLEPGTYVVSLFVNFSTGDAAYGLLIEIPE